ncbi:MAG TPA: sugar porter family MFS transporter [Rhodothermales bacterium]|nr:sugar porter family MFS transporter [Rhodothermales bacterium]
MLPEPATLAPPVRTTHTGYLLGITLVAALGGLLFGFDTAVIAGTIPFITQYFGLSEAMLGWAVSSMLLGCMAGTLVAGSLADRYGRKPVLIGTAVFFFISAVGSAVPTTLTTFVAARMLGGLAVGTASMLSPVYIAEVAPAHLRGRLVSLYQLAIVIGIQASFFSNYALVDTGVDNWRWMFGVEAVPAVAFLFALLFVPETPRFLAKRGRTEEALVVLARTRPADEAQAELAAITSVLQDPTAQRLSDLRAPRLRPILVIGIVLAVLQQVTGINTVMYYAPLIFAQTGASVDSALLQTVAVGGVNLLFTFVAIYLIDRIGRRPLMLAGSALMGVSLAGLSAAFFLDAFQGPLVLLLVLAYIASFAASLGPVVWVIISEIFPTRVRGAAVAVATFVLWTACFVVSLTFPWLLAHLGGAGTFLLFAVLCAVTYVFVWRRLPETRNKSLETLERELVGT